MQIILLENIKNLGQIGDVVNVKNGFGRNFLIRQKKALYATKDNIKEVNKTKEELNRKDLDIKKEAKKISEQINNQKITIFKLVTENNELYGSVKPTEISKIIFDKYNVEIQPSQIDLENEIKAIGSFKGKINLHPEIEANILIEVEKSKDQENQ
tara:strand:+ start:93 stop:557 length:465 start_codon:yes stop_codon:yes gene_type:complete